MATKPSHRMPTFYANRGKTHGTKSHPSNPKTAKIRIDRRHDLSHTDRQGDYVPESQFEFQ